MRFNLIILFCFVSFLGIGQDLKIKSIAETKSNFLGNTISDHVKEFDKNGNVIILMVHDVNGQVDHYRTFEYNSDTLLSKEVGFAENDVKQEVWEYSHDDQGGMICQKRYYPITNRTHTEHFKLEYNELNQLVAKTDFDKDSTASWRHVYVYNRKNEMIKEQSFYQGAIQKETTYKYKGGLLVEEIIFDFDNKKMEPEENTQTYYDYDKSGILIKKTVQSLAEIINTPIVSEEVYSYNKHGLIDTITKSNNGKFYSKTVYKYEFFY